MTRRSPLKSDVEWNDASAFGRGAVPPDISRTIAAALLITIAVLSLVPAQYRPVTGLPHLLEHVSIFLATGVAFGVGYAERRLFQFVTLLGFTAAIELAQVLIPGRHARLSDFLFGALAMSSGLLIGSFALPQLARSEPLEKATSRPSRG